VRASINNAQEDAMIAFNHRQPTSAAALVVASAAQTATGYVRVDQIGYETAQPMRAYLMSASPLSGEQFRVENAAGQVAAAGTVGGRLGDWASYSVYPIDFTLSIVGRYTVGVAGTIGATSPAFPVATPAELYSGSLAKTLQFYRNERDGPDYIASPLRRAPAHLNDASATTCHISAFDADDRIIGRLAPTGGSIDASGGWWDGGDYLKFVETASYTAALMAVGIRDFPNQMGAASTVSDFTAEARFGLDWLQRMWDQTSRTLAYHFCDPFVG
jgi:endoglucanase